MKEGILKKKDKDKLEDLWNFVPNFSVAILVPHTFKFDKFVFGDKFRWTSKRERGERGENDW